MDASDRDTGRYRVSVRSRSPRGFTLVETLVAIILLQLGVFALVATAGVAARDFAESAARRHVRTAARNRAEALRVSACAGPIAGLSRLGAGMVESWRVEERGPNRVVIAIVSVPLSRGRRASAEARALALCP